MSAYDKIAAHVMDGEISKVSIDDLQGLLREYRELHLAVESVDVEPVAFVAAYKARRASGEPYAAAKNAVFLEQRLWQAHQVLKALLLFHQGGPWEPEHQEEWVKLTGTDGANTRNLCDRARAVLGRRDVVPVIPVAEKSPREVALENALQTILTAFSGHQSDDHGEWIIHTTDACEAAEVLLGTAPGAPVVPDERTA